MLLLLLATLFLGHLLGTVDVPWMLLIFANVAVLEDFEILNKVLNEYTVWI